MACFVSAILAGGTVQAQTSPTRSGDSDGANRPTYPNTTRVPKDVLGHQHRDVIVQPSEPGEFGSDVTQRSGGAIAKLPASPHRLPEGYVIALRESRLEQRDDWLVAHLAHVDDLPNAPPLRILPNHRRSMIESVLRDADRSPVFVLTGRITEFYGRNYLLIEALSERSAEPEDEPETEPQATSPPDATEPAGDVDSSATQPAAVREPTAEEVIKRLTEGNPTRSVVLPEETLPADTTSDAQDEGDKNPADETGVAMRKEPVLVDRVGRVIKGEPWWTFTFEDRGRAPRDLPIRLLPNRLLENALVLSGGGTKGITFVISGEVNVYNGQDFLLLRKVLVRRDLGNLR